MTPPRAHIGTSGWSYAHWRGVLYERGTRDQLARYVREFDTVELNTSFYRWPRPERFAAWRDRVPDGFEMTVKAPRGVTHARDLVLTPEWRERIAAGLAALGSRRGPLLAQLPPGARPVMELRHPSWDAPEVYELLESRGAAYCVMSGAGLPCVLRATTSIAYVRLHGPGNALYHGAYGAEAIAWWADRIREWLAQGRDVYAYFNNDLDGHAVRDARLLRDALA